LRKASYLRKPGSLSGESGAATAELVILFPAVALLIGLLVWLGAAQAQRVTVVEAAGQLARAAAINESQVSVLATKLGVGVSLSHSGSWVCAKASLRSGSAWLGAVPIAQKFCTRAEGK
jgi:hypothetical protein